MRNNNNAVRMQSETRDIRTLLTLCPTADSRSSRFVMARGDVLQNALQLKVIDCVCPLVHHTHSDHTLKRMQPNYRYLNRLSREMTKITKVRHAKNFLTGQI